MADETETTTVETAGNGRADVPPARLKGIYESDIRPKLQEEFGYASPMQHPRLLKITLSMGVGEAKTNAKALDEAAEQLAVIAGQRPAITKARRSIAQFKLREGMSIGCKVTLRGARMWEFYDRLTSVALPRIRDFRGINPDSFDGRGNFSLGLREQTIFPEIDYDRVDQVRGLNVTITTSAATDDEARALLRHLGMPFRAEGYTADERAARRRRKMRKYGRVRGRR
jgi:large subunit ribosomal protein L5